MFRPSVRPLNGTAVQGVDDIMMGVAKPDFLRCVGADQISIENAGRFARIDLDFSDCEKERTQCCTVMFHSRALLQILLQYVIVKPQNIAIDIKSRLLFETVKK